VPGAQDESAGANRRDVLRSARGSSGRLFWIAANTR